MGKSSLLLRFADNTYSDNYISTIGVDFVSEDCTKLIPVENKNHRRGREAGQASNSNQILLYSVVGHCWTRKIQDYNQHILQRFANIVVNCVGAHGIIAVYDVTDKESFRAIDNWMGEVDKFASESAIRMLVGNKADSDDKRKVTTEEGKDLAAHYNVKFLETSAKSAKNVQESFQALTKEIKARVLPKKTTPGSTKQSKKRTF